MSSQDNEPLQNIPRIVPDRDDVASYQRQKQGKPKAERSIDAGDNGGGERGGVPVAVFAAVAVALVGWAGYLHWQLTQAEQRVATLEQRLSVTDESVNQSSVAMQVKLKDLDTALTQVRDETLKQHKQLLDKHSSQIENLDKTSRNTTAALAKNDQRDGEQQKTLDGAKEQLDKVAPTVELSKRKLEEQQASLEATADKLNRIAAQQTKLEGRIGTNEEWVQSINTFRVQTNRELVNIKAQLNAGKNPAPAPEPVP